jgi:hypothetical protein
MRFSWFKLSVLVCEVLLCSVGTMKCFMISVTRALCSSVPLHKVAIDLSG